MKIRFPEGERSPTIAAVKAVRGAETTMPPANFMTRSVREGLLLTAVLECLTPVFPQLEDEKTLESVRSNARYLLAFCRAGDGRKSGRHQIIEGFAVRI